MVAERERTMKIKILFARILVWILILCMVGVFLAQLVFANMAIPSTPPQNITVYDIGYESEGDKTGLFNSDGVHQHTRLKPQVIKPRYFISTVLNAVPANLKVMSWNSP
jgi:hypothetical protein